jgi:N-acetylmuramoyl-L-alanine amidase
MKIVNHLLVAEGTERAIDQSRKVTNPKELITADGLPKDLIIHYTVSGLESSLNSLTSPLKSAHLVIARDGGIYQLVPFNRRANHAGYSVWDGNSAFNGRSIGIELVNTGWAVDGLPANQILTKPHKHRFIRKNQWQIYTPQQMQALYTVTKVLLEEYQLQRILGHDDISAGRKQDPGPAFDWDAYRTELFGTSSHIGKIFKTKFEGVKLRKTDSTQFDPIRALPKGYEVGLIETWNNWSRVYLAHETSEVVVNERVNGEIVQKNIKTMGWIRSDLIELK